MVKIRVSVGAKVLWKKAFLVGLQLPEKYERRLNFDVLSEGPSSELL